MKIKYKIEKHKQLTELNKKDIYVVWVEVKTEHGFNIKGIYKGTKKECKQYLEGLKNE